MSDVSVAILQDTDAMIFYLKRSKYGSGYSCITAVMVAFMSELVLVGSVNRAACY
jgi:hypothetical protein